jgi:hypothetical protein
VFGGANGNKDRDASAKLLRVEQGDTLFDIALGLKPLDAFPARIWRQVDSLSHLIDRQRGVLLQEAKQLHIIRIQRRAASHSSHPTEGEKLVRLWEHFSNRCNYHSPS